MLARKLTLDIICQSCVCITGPTLEDVTVATKYWLAMFGRHILQMPAREENSVYNISHKSTLALHYDDSLRTPPRDQHLRPDTDPPLSLLP